MVWSIERLTDETGIQGEVLKGILTLAEKEEHPESALSDAQLSEVQKVLGDLIGDMSTNRKLAAMASMSKRDSGIGSLTINDLREISYRTRNLTLIEPHLDRIWIDFQDVISKQKQLDEREKISLKQFGILYDLAHLNKILKKYDELGFIEGNEKLKQLYAKTQRAETMISYLDKSFDQGFKMPAGAVAFDNTKDKSKILGKTLGFFDKLISLCVTRFGHASKGFAVETNGLVENKISHINPSYKEDKFSLRNYLYNEVYRIKIENLIDEDAKLLLNKHLGGGWLEQIQEKYSQIERMIHDGSSAHGHIVADVSTGRKVSIVTAPLHGGHKNIYINDHKNADIRDDIFGRGRWEEEGRRLDKIICSEFVGKTIIAAIQELNDEIAQKLGENGATNIPEQLIRSPISEKEKLHLLTPERLLTAMQERGALEQVKVPHELSQLVSKNVTSNFRSRIFGMRADSEKKMVSDSLEAPVSGPNTTKLNK